MILRWVTNSQQHLGKILALYRWSLDMPEIQKFYVSSYLITNCEECYSFYTTANARCQSQHRCNMAVLSKHEEI